MNVFFGTVSKKKVDLLLLHIFIILLLSSVIFINYFLYLPAPH